MSCNKPNCDKCAPKSRYCGPNLDCVNAKKGDTYDSILQKIDSIICSESNSYIFEDNRLCENGGIRILDNTIEPPVLLYETCFNCCENFLDQYLIDAKGDIPLFAGDVPVWTNIFQFSFLNEPEYIVPESGKYKIILEEQFSGEDNARYIVGLGVNSLSPSYAPYSESNSNVTTFVILGTAIEYKKTHIFTATLQENDTVSVWVKVLLGGINLDSDIRLTFEKM